MTMHHQNLGHALHEAVGRAPSCVGYRQGKGWLVYKPTEGSPEGTEPELFVPAAGRMPVALSEDGQLSLNSLFRSYLRNVK